MRECDQKDDELLVAVSQGRKTGAPEFQEGDELVLTATFIPGNKCCIEQYQDAAEAFDSDNECDLDWLNDHFKYDAVVKKRGDNRAYYPAFVKAKITKSRNLSFRWRWDTTGCPSGSYTVKVLVDEKDDGRERSDVPPEEGRGSEEFIAVKRAEEMQ